MERLTIDIEDALVRALSADGCAASAPPVPATLGSALPHVCIARTGGYEAGFVQDAHLVDLDVYARSDGEAMGIACGLTGRIRALAGGMLGGVPCYTAEIATMPYANPDPLHADIARATVKAQITTRMA